MLSKKEISGLKDLHKRKKRMETGYTLVEGINAVERAIEAGMKIERLFVSEKFLDFGKKRDMEPVLCSGMEMDMISSTRTSYGITALCGIPCMEEKPLEGDSLYFDRIQDPGNAGTLIRSAVAFGFTNIVFSVDSVDPWSPKVIRSSAGYIFNVNIMSGFRHIKTLKERGALILAAESGGKPLDEIRCTGEVALLMGNEGLGLSDDIREYAGAACAIKMEPGVESLNVAVAGSIIMQHIHGEKSR